MTVCNVCIRSGSKSEPIIIIVTILIIIIIRVSPIYCIRRQISGSTLDPEIGPEYCSEELHSFCVPTVSSTVSQFRMIGAAEREKCVNFLQVIKVLSLPLSLFVGVDSASGLACTEQSLKWT
jgi:hypothetical protein